MGTVQEQCPAGGGGSQLQPGERKGLRKDHPHLLWHVPTHPSHTLTLAATCAQSTAMEVRPAMGTVMAVVQTALAVPIVGVTGSRITGFYIIVALTGPTHTLLGSPPDQGHPK